MCMVKNEEIIVQSVKGSKKIGSGRRAFYLDMENKLVAKFKQIRARTLKESVFRICFRGTDN